ncbi:MAG TPA: TonB family protein [Gammaproteobacteria bacterium]
MSATGRADDSTRQSDALLWLGGALVVGMGAVWLLLAKPWAGDAAAPVEESAADVANRTTAVRQATAPASQPGARTGLESSLERNPLRMAELAFDAGMLVEPAEYSAWTLYQRALQEDPTSTAARDGLEKVAEELLRRAGTAVEQGRFDDARAAVERIRGAFPDHAGAAELASRIEELTRPEPERPPVQARSVESAPAERPRAEAPAPEPEPESDPAVATHDAFTAALAANRLLTPAQASAKYYVNLLASIAPDHELTRQARTQLFNEFLARASEAIASADAEAATTWIDEADLLAVDAAAVAGARDRLRTRLIEIESARRVPASALEVVSYTAPEYPVRALERGLDGWVDIEFTVAEDGTTRDIVITDASHTSFFRREAVEAVEQWRFAPRVFMGETIEQRAYTRIRFDFE